MGLDRIVTFPAGHTPAWEAVKEQLLRVGEPGTLRMIDGLPAFPDELPPEDWKELRVAAGGAGMLTVRRTSAALTCVVWGNADPGVRASWDRFVWACAAAGDGRVQTDAGAVTAVEFAQLTDIRPA